MSKKAEKLEKSKDMSCLICFLKKSDNPKIKYNLVSEGSFYNRQDRYVCGNCLEWIRKIRKDAIKQCQNPKEDIFKDLTFWHDPNGVKKSAVEVKNSTGIS